MVTLAKYSGFCLGVKQAVDTALEVCGEGVYILGEIIHNESVVKRITDLGTTVVADIDEVDPSKCKKLIIRSHGVGKVTLQKIKERNIDVINCTCPFVMKTQQIVQTHFNEGYKIVIIGERYHPEVVGINGWCNDQALIIDSVEELSNVKSYEKVCVVVQTTYSLAKYQQIIKKIVNYGIKTLEVFNTICYTTIKRQREAEKLSKENEAMIVVGGKNSNNTKKLMEICQKNCDNVFYVSSPDELDYNLVKKFLKVGIVSGASTPNEQSMEVFINMEGTEVKSMEAVVEAMKETKFRVGDIIKATISSATDDGLALYITGTKKEINLPKSELVTSDYNKENYQDGSEIEVMVMATNPVALSEKAVLAKKEEEEKIEAIKNGETFTVVIDGANKGGLTAKFGSYSVFIPSSQIKLGFVQDKNKYVGKTLRVKADTIEVKGRRKQIVASQRVILEAEKQAREEAKAKKEAEFFANISEGDVVTGKVVRVAQFGAFVDVNGFDCLAHISDLSWTNAKKPEDVLEIGKSYEFKVLKCDEATKKVSLGYKQLQPKPWQLAGDKYAIGDTITGKVVRIVNFGAFVEVEKGIDGLVHVSQISHEYLENPATALKVGDEVNAQILDIDVEKEKMTLSIKALLPIPEAKEKKEDNKEEKPKRERKAKKEAVEDEEPRGWSDSSFVGASIAELINKD